ncbi:hypothetical protein EVAR_57622_1 [Eumeta japonica]|uniref:Uncharacterized protein n=1 Tax=Eumeta variegata TaxID=151549 RepID=A0A4C1XXI5_EUMVA|nr:hypothetical protein EVAR_57622_1 [Eumeta japonica]
MSQIIVMSQIPVVPQIVVMSQIAVEAEIAAVSQIPAVAEIAMAVVSQIVLLSQIAVVFQMAVVVRISAHFKPSARAGAIASVTAVVNSPKPLGQRVQSKGKRTGEPSGSSWSPPPMSTRNPGRVASALPASRELKIYSDLSIVGSAAANNLRSHSSPSWSLEKLDLTLENPGHQSSRQHNGAVTIDFQMPLTSNPRCGTLDVFTGRRFRRGACACQSHLDVTASTREENNKRLRISKLKGGCHVFAIVREPVLLETGLVFDFHYQATLKSRAEAAKIIHCRSNSSCHLSIVYQLGYVLSPYLASFLFIFRDPNTPVLIPNIRMYPHRGLQGMLSLFASTSRTRLRGELPAVRSSETDGLTCFSRHRASNLIRLELKTRRSRRPWSKSNDRYR